MKFTTAYPSLTTQISSQRIYFFTGGEAKDKITATFEFFGIEIADMTKDPTLEIDLVKDAFSIGKTASLEVEATDLRTGTKYRQVRQNAPYGTTRINVLSNYP